MGFALGETVIDPKRGEGVVHEINALDNGNGMVATVKFANGETHRYKPKAQEKLQRVDPPPSFAVGDRVSHLQHGEGIIHEIVNIEDGSTILVKFDNGDHHHFKPRAWHKLKKLNVHTVFEKGDYVRHAQHGEGIIGETINTEGGVVVVVIFDSGKEHRYKQKALCKLEKVYDEATSCQVPAAAVEQPQPPKKRKRRIWG